MGAAASTQKPSLPLAAELQHGAVDEGDNVTERSIEHEGLQGPDSPHAPTNHSRGSQRSSHSSRNEATPSSVTNQTSRPLSTAMPGSSILNTHVWKFVDSGDIPEAYMKVEPEGQRTTEDVLADIQADIQETVQPTEESLDSKIKRVHVIMAQLDGDERIVMLDEHSRQTREVRVNVAKRLAELREEHDIKRQRQVLNRKKELLYQKAEMVEQILEKKRKQVQLQKDIERYEGKEVAAIEKLEQLKVLLAEREEAHQQACSEWKEKFKPVVAAMPHVGDVGADVLMATAAGAGAGAVINADITRELQSLLSKTLVNSSAELYTQRASLHRFRLDLEKRLDVLRSQNPSLSTKPMSPAQVMIKLLHQPGDKLIRSGAAFEQRLRSNISDFKDRIKLYQDEAMWLQTTPSTQAWSDLENELSSVTKRNEMLEKVENARAFVVSWHETKAMRQLDDAREAREAREEQIKKIAKELMSEVVKSFVSGVCAHVSTLTNTADAACTQYISYALAGRNTRMLPDTMNLVCGNIYETAVSNLYGPRVQHEVGAPPSLLCCERNPIATPSVDAQLRSKCAKEISLKKLLMQPRDSISIEQLVAHELMALDDLAVAPVDGKMKLPGSAGELSLLRILPRCAAAQSLLVAGTSIGRFVVWKIIWDNTSPPLKVAYSPRLPCDEVSPMVDLKESPTSQNLIVTLDKRGCVRVWTLNPPSKKGKHSGRSFAKNEKNFTPFVPACIFLLTPSELNLPLPPPLSQFNGNNKPLDAQPGVQPKSICFHPACNFAGRNQSFMVGTEGGDLYKINMDFKETALAAPILYMKPFVFVEFPHPLSNQGQVSADPSTDATVNKVYREVFHFHKSPIMFLDVLYRASQHIVSVDASGIIAKWNYNPDFFNGNGWFIPESTTYLDLSFLSHQPLPNDPEHPSPEMNGYTEKIDCPPAYVLDSEISVFSMYHMSEVDAAQPVAKVQLSVVEVGKLQHRFRHISKLATMSIRGSAAQEASRYIVDILVESVFEIITNRSDKSRIMKDMYGSDESLGVIFPTSWPSGDQPCDMGIFSAASETFDPYPVRSADEAEDSLQIMPAIPAPHEEEGGNLEEDSGLLLPLDEQQNSLQASENRDVAFEENHLSDFSASTMEAGEPYITAPVLIVQEEGSDTGKNHFIPSD